MTLESALYAAVTGVAAINAIISGRMVRDTLPDDYALPAIVYREISYSPALAHDGDQAAAQARYQLDCWATAVDSAESLANAVRVGMNGYRSASVGGRKLGGVRVDNIFSVPDAETQLSRRIVDLLIWDEGDV